MTKTRKIICIALVIAMIGAAVFFAIYKRVGNTYDYAKIKDYSKYITMRDITGVAFDADDSALEAPDAEDVRTEVASKLRGYIETDENGTNIKVTDGDAVIGEFDVVYVNYYGTYEDDNGNTIYFTKGAMMDQSTPVAFYVKSGDASLLFANELDGKSPNPDDYKLKATGAEGDDSVIADNNVVYITYTWVRYKYQEDGVTIDESTKETNTSVNSTLVTRELRLDLSAVPAYFPDGFKDGIVGKKVGALDTMTFDNVEIESVKYQYQYNVTVNRVIDAFNGFEVDYTFSADATDKDQDGNELKGQNVNFYVVISSFDNVPDYAATFPKDDSAEAEQVSVFFADDKLNFDATAYFEENVKSEADWLALDENAGKGHDDYIAYVGEQYEAYVEKDLTDTYDDSRMKVAAKPMWEKIVEQISAVTPPKRALKLAKNDLLSQFKYVFNNATFENEAGKTVSYRTQYGSFKKFMAACYKSDDVIKALDLGGNAAYNQAIEDGKTYGECVDAAANEIVRNKLLIYALYDKLGDEVKIDEAEFESARSLMYMYYYYGISNTLLPDSSLRESMMFDNVMKYIYDHANVEWATAGENP